MKKTAPAKRREVLKDVNCGRCSEEFTQTSFAANAQAIMNSMPLCSKCSELWKQVRKERGLSNANYVMETDTIDW